MARKSVKLLLIENVENLGIVGDIIKATPGYARNFLLPHGLAEAPNKKRIEELQERRKQVQAELAQERATREELHQRMVSVEVKITRSCNDQGMLYGSVSQRDISEALVASGYDVNIRAVRLGQPIKRVGTYHVPVQLERDLRTEVTLIIEPDHAIGEEREEMDFDNEGNLITPERRKAREARQKAREERAGRDDRSNAAPAADSGRSKEPKAAEEDADGGEAKPKKSARKAKAKDEANA